VQSTTPRGFTDHEHVDNLGVIHMNGRVYDPVLGRFLSPDPVVQAPYDAQSWNRYSYVRNNPLRYTDPSGFVCFNSAPPGAFAPDYCFRNLMETVVVQASRIRDSLSSLSVDLWRSAGSSDGFQGTGSLSAEGGEAVNGGEVGQTPPTPGMPTEEIVVTAPRDPGPPPVTVDASPDVTVPASLGAFVSDVVNWEYFDDAVMLAVGVLAAAEPSPVGEVALAIAGKETVEEAFHYTFRRFAGSIQRQGLRGGSYATPNGSLSPLQAQIDLALPANRGLPDTLIRIDLSGLRNAGFQVPRATRVPSNFRMPGGGEEMYFSYPVPSKFLEVIEP
jgi:RHS repeat-associated protein